MSVVEKKTKYQGIRLRNNIIWIFFRYKRVKCRESFGQKLHFDCIIKSKLNPKNEKFKKEAEDQLKGNEKKLVLYWYQNPFGSHDNLLFQKLHLLITKIRYGKEENAFIRISTPVNGDAKKAWNTIIEFLNDFYPALLRYLSTHT